MENHQFSLQDILCRTLNDLSIPTSYLSEITGLTPQAVNKFRRGSGKTKIATLDSIIQSVSVSYPGFWEILIDRMYRELNYRPPGELDKKRVVVAVLQNASFEDTFQYSAALSKRILDVSTKVLS